MILGGHSSDSLEVETSGQGRLRSPFRQARGKRAGLNALRMPVGEAGILGLGTALAE